MTEESEITQVVLAASPGESKLETQNRSPLFKIARVLVRLIKLPCVIANANHSIMRPAEKLGVADCVAVL